MGRGPRIEFFGACYHVVQRGNNQEKIFQRDKEKKYFIDTLKIAADKYDFNTFGYVVMNNHYHLLLQIKKSPLRTIMHQINTRFALHYNNANNRKGHVFQGRYKAYLVLDELYLITVLRYIHQNPVRANLVAEASEYPWSSDRFYRYGETGFVDTGLILGLLSHNRQEGVLKYRQLMGELLDDKIRKRVYSSDFSLEQLQKETAACSAYPEETTADTPPEKEDPRAKELDRILLRCCSSLDEYKMIKRGVRSRHLNAIKRDYILQARRKGYTFEEVGANISLSRQAVYKLITDNTV
ncbi:MAG TPA: transposase [Bacillota bacterium]|nr:hypothetical protein [Bacillota bacterium]HOB87414.1 transposase [Bacillota bacterium]HOP68956.1 transposase [Bacillota bacterium]HPT33896.1 transposase [Bacillota bacterium]HQD05656.1 transposase [Bacillota bacterium]